MKTGIVYRCCCEQMASGIVVIIALFVSIPMWRNHPGIKLPSELARSTDAARQPLLTNLYHRHENTSVSMPYVVEGGSTTGMYVQCFSV
jgi:hypothetical protein